MARLSNYDPSRHHRRSIRLKGYDYSSPGFYFVTLNTHAGKKIFGQVVDGKMMLNDFGQLVDFTWHDLPNHNSNIRLDHYVIMPEHFHGIIELTDGNVQTDNRVCHPLSEIIRQFKTFSARRINMLAPMSGRVQNPPRHQTPPIPPKGRVLNPPRQEPTPTPSQPVWQRDYYEQIIRNRLHLERVRLYIDNNPSRYRR